MVWVRKFAVVLSMIALLTGIAVAARPLDPSKLKPGEVVDCSAGRIMVGVKHDAEGRNYFFYTFEDERIPFVVAVNDNGEIYAWADRNRDGKVDIEGDTQGDNDLGVSLCDEAEKAAKVKAPAKKA